MSVRHFVCRHFVCSTFCLVDIFSVDILSAHPFYKMMWYQLKSRKYFHIHLTVFTARSVQSITLKTCQSAIYNGEKLQIYVSRFLAEVVADKSSQKMSRQSQCQTERNCAFRHYWGTILSSP